VNGLLDAYYNSPTLVGGNGASSSGGGSLQTLGANAGLNVGSELFRVQAGVTGLLLAAFVVLLLLHRGGHRFSTHVGR